jgi:hypothetical protein
MVVLLRSEKDRALLSAWTPPAVEARLRVGVAVAFASGIARDDRFETIAIPYRVGSRSLGRGFVCILFG